MTNETVGNVYEFKEWDSPPTFGFVTTYEGDGYVVDLSLDRVEMLRIFQQLEVRLDAKKQLCF